VRGWIAQVPWGTWRPRIRAAGYAPGRPPREAGRDVGELLALFAAARQLDTRRAASGGALPDVEAKCAAIALLGVRQRELGALRWSDVDEAAAVVRIKSTKQGKTVELRADPVLFEVLAHLRACLEARQLYAPRGPVFPALDSSPGKPQHTGPRTDCLPREVLRHVAKIAELPKPERWSAQSLRDTFVTLENEGHHGDLKALRDRSRHASLASLVRYLQSRSRAPAAPGFSMPAAPARRALPA
jgi:integrase